MCMLGGLCDVSVSASAAGMAASTSVELYIAQYLWMCLPVRQIA